MQMVADRRVDASAIDSHCLSVELRGNEAFRRSLRIIETLGPSPIQPIAISKRIDSSLRRRIVETLKAFHGDEEGRRTLALGMVDRFVEVAPSDYDETRRMLQACEDANFLQIR